VVVKTPMHSVPLKRLTSFDYAVGIGYLEVWVNPSTVAYCQPRRRFDSKSDQHVLDGTRLFFQQESGVLDVKESIGQVVAMLKAGDKGICRDCYQILDEAWRTVCDDCAHHRHCGVDADPEEALA
jgi:hypothetical protein